MFENIHTFKGQTSQDVVCSVVVDKQSEITQSIMQVFGQLHTQRRAETNWQDRS